MSYFFPAKTNHRRVRQVLMQGAMRRLAAGSPEGRRAVEGVTHILKGATYIPQFNQINIDAAIGNQIATMKQAQATSGKARGLRKGALWCAALNRAGIPVALDYFNGTDALPALVEDLVNIAAATLHTTMTDKEVKKIAKVFDLPIEEVFEGWTEAHDILCAQGLVEGNANKVAAAYYDASGGEITPDMAEHMSLTQAALGGKWVDEDVDLMHDPAAAPAVAQTTAKAIAQDMPDGLEAMIAAMVEEKMKALA